MTPLIMLPGMMCDARLFAAQVDVLAEKRPVSVLSISDHITVSRLANAVLDVAPPRFALAGLSLGGIVAMEMIRQAPARVERLALLDTNPTVESEVAGLNRTRQIARVKNGKFVAVMQDALKSTHLQDSAQRVRILDLCIEMALDLGPDVFVRQSLAIKNRPDQRKTLKTIGVPTLILMGAEDTLFPRDGHELMRGLIPGSKFVTVSNAGHLPPLEQPELTTTHLQAWLEA